MTFITKKHLSRRTFLRGTGVTLFDPLPVVLIGGASGQIRGGRHIRHAPQTPMANLLLTMLDKMGARVDAIGDSTGRLEI